MVTLKGKYNEAKVFTDNIDNSTMGQIINLLNQEFVKNSKIRIMPDTHAGMGCVIGTTMTIEDKVVPNLVGVDIGCGMETLLLKDRRVELPALDSVIREYIPSGFDIRNTPHKYTDEIEFEQLHCFEHINYPRAALSLGTLGGGNHFIELGKNDEGQYYLVVHSGSRNMGKQIADYYQQAAYKYLRRHSDDVKKVIEELKLNGREKDIQKELKKIKVNIDKNLAYADGELCEKYLHDMAIAQKYAMLNRKAIVDTIIKKMKFKPVESFTTVHNYIDLESKILRKGAISAKKGEIALIPINMRDGSLVCRGKGNEDWNCSAPHGAGRLMSRSEAKHSITLSQFKKSMDGIYSTTVTQSTIDESPFAYKPMEEIMQNISDTADIVSIIKPVYNFKASD